MRDIIWTVIILWLVFKVINLVKGIKPKNQSATTVTGGESKKPARHSFEKQLDRQGEYVDYEEVK